MDEKRDIWILTVSDRVHRDFILFPKMKGLLIMGNIKSADIQISKSSNASACKPSTASDGQRWVLTVMHDAIKLVLGSELQFLLNQAMLVVSVISFIL